MKMIQGVVAAVAGGLMLSACAMTDSLTPADVANLELPNPQIVGSSVITGGQPTERDLERLRDTGVTTVITLRRDDEDSGFDEKTVVETLGMTYVSLPVSMSDGLDVETATALRTILDNSDGAALVHCGSGNRVGALYAIGAYEIDGVSLEQALEIGRTAGMTRLEPRIREMLEAAGSSAGEGEGS